MTRIFPICIASLQILYKNKNITNIVIKDCPNLEGSSQFFESLSTSGVTSLTLSYVPFSHQMITELSTHLPKSLTMLSFKNCNCNTFHLNVLFDNPRLFENIRSFTLSNNETNIPAAAIPKVISFISVSKITSLNLRNLGIDIALVFRELLYDFQLMYKDRSFWKLLLLFNE